MNEADGATIDKSLYLVDGATGYVGSHLVAALRRRGDRVRALVHRGAAAEDVALLKTLGSEVITGDLLPPSEQLTDAFRGAKAAVHLIGSIAPKRGENWQTLHIEQTRAFVGLCRQAGVHRIIMVTALGTAAAAKTGYQASKWQAEEVVRQSGISFVVLRPSLIVGHTFGRRHSKLVKRYLTFIEKGRTVPLIAGGCNRVQPLFIEDLVAAILHCLQLPDHDPLLNHELELAGNEIMTMKDFVELLMSAVDKKVPFLAVPAPLAAVVASILELVQAVPMLSRDQVKLAGQDNICGDTNALSQRLAIEPTPIRLALSSYNSRMPDH